MLTNPGKLFLAEGTAMFVSDFFPKLLNEESKDPPDWINLDILTLLSFVSVDILLAKAFLILVACLVRNNLCGNCSTSKYFLFNFNIVIFAADFNLFIVYLLV